MEETEISVVKGIYLLKAENLQCVLSVRDPHRNGLWPESPYICKTKEFGLYPLCNRELMENVKQGNFHE